MLELSLLAPVPRTEITVVLFPTENLRMKLLSLNVKMKLFLPLMSWFLVWILTSGTTEVNGIDEEFETVGSVSA